MRENFLREKKFYQKENSFKILFFFFPEKFIYERKFSHGESSHRKKILLGRKFHMKENFSQRENSLERKFSRKSSLKVLSKRKFFQKKETLAERKNSLGISSKKRIFFQRELSLSKKVLSETQKIQGLPPLKLKTMCCENNLLSLQHIRKQSVHF